SNSATGTGSGGGIYNGPPGTATLTNSSFVGNSSAYADQGGGALWTGGTMNVINCTLTANRAAAGGAIYLGNGSYNSNPFFGVLNLTDSTVAINVATGTSQGGGIYNNSGTATLNDSIVARNGGGDVKGTGLA